MKVLPSFETSASTVRASRPGKLNLHEYHRDNSKTTTDCLSYKVKGNIHPITGHEGPEGKQMHSYTLSLTSALDGVRSQRHAPAALPPGKRPGTHCI